MTSNDPLMHDTNCAFASDSRAKCDCGENDGTRKKNTPASVNFGASGSTTAATPNDMPPPAVTQMQGNPQTVTAQMMMNKEAIIKKSYNDVFVNTEMDRNLMTIKRDTDGSETYFYYGQKFLQLSAPEWVTDWKENEVHILVKQGYRVIES